MRAPRGAARALVFLAGILVAVGVYAHLIEPRWLDVNRYEIEGTRLAGAMDGLRMVVLADVHVRRFGALEKDVVRTVRRLQPDLVVWLGDYVKYGGGFDGALELLSAIDAPLGAWGVLGDAEYRNSRGHCILCHRPSRREVRTDLPVRFLRDDSVVLNNRGSEFAVVGLDPQTHAYWDEMDWVFDLAADTPTIVLAHYPRALRQLDGKPVDLILAGDTHGGQVAVPGAFDRYLHHPGDRNYVKGWFEADGTAMYVSRGIGTSHLPIRLGERPEIVVFDFRGTP